MDLEQAKAIIKSEREAPIALSTIQNAQRSCKEFLRCAPDGITLLQLAQISLLA